MSDEMLEYLSNKLCKSDFLDVITGSAVISNYAVYRILWAISEYLNNKLDKTKEQKTWKYQLNIEKYFKRLNIIK